MFGFGGSQNDAEDDKSDWDYFKEGDDHDIVAGPPCRRRRLGGLGEYSHCLTHRELEELPDDAHIITDRY